MAKKAKKVQKKVTQTVQPPQVIQTTQKVPTHADKLYIRENYNKLTEEQIAKNTGLSIGQISELISSPELDDISAQDIKNKPINLRRFAKINGTVQMTEAQASLDDRTLRDSGAAMTMEERYGPDFSRIEFKKENIRRGQ